MEMARSATTLDGFSAIAEPKRRQVLELLRRGECPVGELTVALGWTQPQVSKHLGVLKKVGLVHVRTQGRQRMYSLNGRELKSIHEWTGTFEKYWSNALNKIKQRAEANALADANRQLVKRNKSNG